MELLTTEATLTLQDLQTEICAQLHCSSVSIEATSDPDSIAAAAATGTFNEAVRDAALTRASDAGAVLINWFAVACELQRDWRRPPNAGQGLADLLSTYLPEYGNLINSHLVATAGGNTSAAKAAPAIASG